MRPLLKPALLVSCWAASVLVARASPAEAPALSWVRSQGAEQCPGAPEVAEALEEWMGPVLVSPANADLSVEGMVAPGEGDVFHARIVISRADGTVLGERAWSVGSDCSRVTRQAAFIVTVTLDPSALELAAGELATLFPGPDDPADALRQELEAAAAGSQEAEPADEAPAEAPVLPEPPAQEPDTPPASPEGPGRRAAGGGLLGFFASPEEITAGGSILLATTLGRSPLWLSFEVELLVPRMLSLPESEVDGSARIRHWRAQGRGALCARLPGPERLAVSPCVGALVGALVSQGLGFQQDSLGSSLLAGITLAGDLETVLGPVHGYARLGVDWLARRAEASYTDPRGRDVPALQTSRFAGQLTLGIRHRW